MTDNIKIDNPDIEIKFDPNTHSWFVQVDKRMLLKLPKEGETATQERMEFTNATLAQAYLKSIGLIPTGRSNLQYPPGVRGGTPRAHREDDIGTGPRGDYRPGDLEG
jgi:hypothetical protein